MAFATNTQVNPKRVQTTPPIRAPTIAEPAATLPNSGGQLGQTAFRRDRLRESGPRRRGQRRHGAVQEVGHEQERVRETAGGGDGRDRERQNDLGDLADDLDVAGITTRREASRERHEHERREGVRGEHHDREDDRLRLLVGHERDGDADHRGSDRGHGVRVHQPAHDRDAVQPGGPASPGPPALARPGQRLLPRTSHGDVIGKRPARMKRLPGGLHPSPPPATDTMTP